MAGQGFDVAVQGRVARLALDAPPLNILTTALQAAARDAVRGLARRDDINLLVLEGGVPGTFSAGADVREHLGREACAAMLAASRGLIAELLRFPVPTLAVIDGPCLGGGFELLLACDQWLVSDGAQFGLPEVTLGCYPPAAIVLGGWKLPAPLAAELIQSGRTLSAAEFAARCGARLVERDALAGTVATECARYEGLPRGVLAEATRVLRPGAAERFEAQIGSIEAAYLERLLSLDDANTGPTAFLAKSRPVWNHRSVM